MSHMHLQVHATCCSARLPVQSEMKLGVTSARHQIIGIWGGGVEQLSCWATLFQHSRRRVSTLSVRHGDAASATELKGVRLPLIKACVHLEKGRRKPGRSAVVLEGQLLRIHHGSRELSISVFILGQKIGSCMQQLPQRPAESLLCLFHAVPAEETDRGLLPDAAYDDAFASCRLIWGCAGG